MYIIISLYLYKLYIIKQHEMYKNENIIIDYIRCGKAMGIILYGIHFAVLGNTSQPLNALCT